MSSLYRNGKWVGTNGRVGERVKIILQMNKVPGLGSADAAVNNIDYTQSIPENIVRVAEHDGIRSSGSALE